jgi:hypothetical protein
MLREDRSDEKTKAKRLDSTHQANEVDDEAEVISCRTCDAVLSSSEHIIIMGSMGATQAFSNPGGHLR